MSNISDDVVIAGKKLRCNHCSGGVFVQSRAQLNTRGMTFLGLDFANRTAETFSCRNCGHVHWFDQAAIRLPNDKI